MQVMPRLACTSAFAFSPAGTEWHFAQAASDPAAATEYVGLPLTFLRWQVSHDATWQSPQPRAE